MHRTYRVRVCYPETPAELKFVESQAHGFTVRERTSVLAEKAARRRARENGIDTRSLAHAPGDVITILARSAKAGA